jgi:methionine sulfoxide reductase heme-binding subunit
MPRCRETLAVRKSQDRERQGCDMSVAAAAGGSQGLWFVSRASGLVLLVLLSAVVVLGVASHLGVGPRRWPRFVFVELHRTLALFLAAFLALHVITAILDPFVSIGWAATVLPFTSGYRTLAIGLGTLAVDFGGAVLVTSVARARLGFRAWRAVHWLVYLAWPAAFAHSLTAGNDLGIWWVAVIVWGCAAVVATAVLARLIAGIRHDTGSSTPAGQPSASYQRVTARARIHS